MPCTHHRIETFAQGLQASGLPPSLLGVPRHVASVRAGAHPASASFCQRAPLALLTQDKPKSPMQLRNAILMIPRPRAPSRSSVKPPLEELLPQAGHRTSYHRLHSWAYFSCLLRSQVESCPTPKPQGRTPSVPCSFQRDTCALMQQLW